MKKTFLKRSFVKLFLVIVMLYPISSTAQDTSFVFWDSSSITQPICGEVDILRGAISPSGVNYYSGEGFGPELTSLSAGDYNPAAIQHCNAKFDVYYDDIEYATGIGFDDPTVVSGSSLGTTLGQIRRGTFCAVLNYIVSVFDFSNVLSTNKIRIHVGVSPLASAGVTWAAIAYPQYNPIPNSIIGGYLNDYVLSTSSTDLCPATGFHADISVNFNFNWQSDYLATYGNCKYDLFSGLLHEMGHAMGHFSLIRFPIGTAATGLTPYAILTGYNSYSKIDNSIWVGPVFPIGTSTRTKLITSTGSSYTLNTTLTCNNNYWINNNDAPDNYGVFSGAFVSGGSATMISQYIWHLEGQQASYAARERISPGDRLGYVMGPYGFQGVPNREFTKADIYTFVNALGYTLNTVSYTPTHPYILSNHLPFSKKIATYPWLNADIVETMPADYPAISNGSGVHQVILLSDATFSTSDLLDNDLADPKYIDLNSLFNIRGCGSLGGNDHAQLVPIMSGTNCIGVDYYPRADFVGRAQFGFNVTDGKEKGGFRIVTIDVDQGSLPTVPAVGANLVINGDFESGTEVRKLGADETKGYTTVDHDLMWEGKVFAKYYDDSHPYCFHNINIGPYGGGTIIRNSFVSCSDATIVKSGFGSGYNSFPLTFGIATFPTPSSGDRYQTQFGTVGASSYYYLSGSADHCNSYDLEFDFYHPTTAVPTIKIGFTNALATGWGYPVFNHSLDYSIVAPAGWTHVVVPILYCSTTSSKILFISNTTSNQLTIDNLSLKETTPPALTVTISQTALAGCLTQLTATPSDVGCGLTYLWSGSGITGSTTASVIVPSGVAATYSVTVTDVCSRSGSTTFDITETYPDPISGPVSLCQGATMSLANTVPGGAWTSSSSSIATVHVSTGLVSGVSAGTATITYTTFCSHYVTKTITVDAIPSTFSITGAGVYCAGGSGVHIVLSGSTSGVSYKLYAGTTLLSTLSGTGSSLDFGYYSSAGVYTIVATSPAAGCTTTMTGTVTINPLPVAIVGLDNICVGSTTALTNATTGGTWTSSAPTVASVGATTGLVTGLSVGTATITYTITSTGCYVTKAFTVNPIPAAIGGPDQVCVGSTITLTNATSGGIWSTIATGIATVGSLTGIVTGVAAGIASITYRLPAGCYSTILITVNPLPAPIAGPSVVCSGSFITLTNSTPGGTWSSSSISVATVGISTGIVTGIGASTAIISYTVGGCSSVKAVTVNPIPAPITGVNVICDGGYTTLSDPTLGGTWSTSDVTIGTVDPFTGVVTAVSAGVAIVTYTAGSFGCFTTKVVTVFSSTDPCSPCVTLATSWPFMMGGWVTSSYTGGPIYIYDDVIISGFVTLTHNNILIAPGKHIYVNEYSALKISGGHLFSCGMWEGIAVLSNTTSTGTLVLEADADGQHSLIEDAITAVQIENPVTPSGASGSATYFLTCESTTFNRNITGISIKHYNNTAATYPFRIRNTVFTSRDISAHWPGYPHSWPKTWSSTASDVAFKHSYTPITDPLFKPPFTIDDPDAMGTGNNFPGAACKSGALPTIGIRLDSVGTFTPSGTSHFSIPIPSSYSEIVIGDETATTRNQYENLFDNLRYGIHATNTNFTCVNNSFINIFSYTGDIMYGGDPGGYGVFALASTSLNRLRVHSGSGSAYTNKFYGFRVAVGCNNYFNFTGKNTYMINKNTGVFTGSMFNSDGEAGYKLKSAKYSNIDVSYNTITNVHTGVAFWISVDPGGYSASGGFYPSQLIGSCNITYNRIQADPTWPTISLGTNRIDQGIVVQNMISGSAVGPISSSRTVGNLNVSANLIHNAYNGIFVNNYWPRNPYGTYTSVDTVYLRSNPVSNYKRMRLQYGINHTQSRKGYLYDNKVYGLIHAAGNDSIRAFYVSSWNSGMDMGCNLEENVGRGYEFHLTNLGTRWHHNSMQNNLIGMNLNGAVIGIQNGGVSGHPMSNTWLGSWSATNKQTFTYLAPATSSPFYVNSGASTNPTWNYGVPFANAYSSSGSIFTSTVTPTSCSPLSSPPNDSLDLFSLIAQQHVAYTYNTVSSFWMGQYALWKSILIDSTITDSSAIAAQFAHMADSMSRYKYLTEMESLLAAGDFDSVTAMLGYDIDSMANTAYHSALQVNLADSTSANFIVQNYQQFYSLYMKYATSTLSGSDSLDLFVMAELCPQIHGGVVHQARALYSVVFNDLRIFNDDSCLDVDSGYIAGKHYPKDNDRVRPGEQQNYSLFPNPNDGSFTIQQYLPDTGIIKTVVYDAVGRKIYINNMLFYNKYSNLNIKNYPPGLYLLEVTDSKKQIFRLKFVIDK